MNDKINILDVSIRDGSYTVNFQYTAEQVKDYVARLQSAGVEWAEIGHGLGFGAGKFGFTGKTSDDIQVAAASEVARSSKKPIKLGVICSLPVLIINDLKQVAKDLTFARVMADVLHPEYYKDAIEKIKNMGLKAFVQLVRSSSVDIDKVEQSAVKMKEYGADVIYIVDTAGCFLPHEVSEYICRIKDATAIDVGFHGHNNLMLAVANTIEAVKAGATFVDASLKGIGRGSGNVPIEILVMVLKRMKYGLHIDERQLIKAADRIHEQLLQYLPKPSGFDPYMAVRCRDFFPFYLLEAVANKIKVPMFDIINDIALLNPGTEITIDELGDIINKHGFEENKVFRSLGLIP